MRQLFWSASTAGLRQPGYLRVQRHSKLDGGCLGGAGQAVQP
jgi:hypothetical protein